MPSDLGKHDLHETKAPATKEKTVDKSNDHKEPVKKADHSSETHEKKTKKRKS